MWAYYERRVGQRDSGTTTSMFQYFTDLGAHADLDVINAESETVHRRLQELPPTSFLDLGAGPTGTLTRLLPGRGLALDQSRAALRALRELLPNLPLIQGDAMRIPLADSSVGRVLISNLYGLLLPDERAGLVAEASRVGRELVIVDSGRPPDARPEEWQTRTLPDGTACRIFRRHFDVGTLISEVGGDPLVDGQYFVMIRRPTP